MPVNDRIQIRRGSSATWSSVNNNLGPVLYLGEVGYETDTGRIKVGDGSTVWNNLPYSFLTYNDIVGNSGVSISYLSNASGQTTGINITSVVSVSNGTGIHVVKTNSDFNINVSGLTSSLINDFNSAVDARVAIGSISPEQVRDIMGTGIVGGTGIYVFYDDDGDELIHIHATGLAYASHTHTLSQITDITASSTEVNYLDGTTLGTVTSGNVVAVDANKDITGFRDVSIDRNLVVGGNLTVQGTTTTVNSTTVNIGDNIVQVNVSGAETQGGLQVLDHDNSKLHQVVWDINNNRWEFISNSGASPNVYTSGNITANTVTSTVPNGTAPFSVSSNTLVTNLNSDLLDGQHGSYYTNFNNLSNLPSPIITGILTGDVTGTSSVTLSQLGNGVLTINTTIGANSISLGTDTTGQYASTIAVSGIGLSATTPLADDGTAYVISSNATPSNNPNTIVARDSNGNFSAGTISGTFSGNGSSITSINADNISAGTLNAARLPTINVTKLSASGITIGSTVVNLGETKTGFSDLTALSGTSAASPLVITYAHIDGGTP